MSNSEQGNPSPREGEEIVAKRMIQRITREENLLEKAEGRLALQNLPLLFVAVVGLLWLYPPLRSFLTAVWVVAPVLLIQAALWSTGRRMDALLDLVRGRVLREDLEGEPEP